MSMEKMVEKVRKCLELAKSDNQHEAESAALMAQKLMAKHGIEASDLDYEDELTIAQEKVDLPESCKWKLQLGVIVADNFRCKVFTQGSRVLVFYGHSQDAKAAKSVYEYLFKTGHRLGLKEQREYKKVYGHSTGVYNSFTRGYMSGIRKKLEVQATALMIVTPKEVNEAWEDYSGGMKKQSASLGTKHVHSAYDSGVSAGKSAMGKRELEG